MNSSAPLLTTLLALLFAAPALAEPEPLSGTLEVVSYNVHGLPGFVTGDDTLARLRRISPRLRAFDVVGLQEDFLDEGHSLLLGGTDHPARRRFASKLPQRVYGSGLTTLARAKVLATRELHFTTFHGVVGAGADGLASKGFQITRLQLAAGVELDVYNSHLDAGGALGDSRARASQVAQLTSAIQTFSAGRAVLFLGDTNLKPERPRDARILAGWLEATSLPSGPRDLLRAHRPGPDPGRGGAEARGSSLEGPRLPRPPGRRPLRPCADRGSAALEA